MAETDRSSEVDERPTKAISLFSEKATSSERQRIWLLLAAHIVLGPLFCGWSATVERMWFALEYILIVPVFGFVLAQTSLLGFWVAFSRSAWWVRLLSLFVGSIYLGVILDMGAQADHFGVMPSMATVGIAAVFRTVRWWYVDLRRLSQKDPSSSQEGLKFSIRGLMVFTLLVAITIVAVRTFRNHVPTGPSFVVVLIWSLCFVVTGLAGAWAGLGLGRPTLRSVVVIGMSGILGALFVYGIGEANWETYFYLISMMVLQAAVVILSLLVVRSCGYRLVRRSVTDVVLLDGAEERQLS